MLAAAAYNAGPGNANKWIEAYRRSRARTSVDPVVWVELIPLEETRKYVKRVLGNYLVYRARLGDGEIEHRRRAAAHSGLAAGSAKASGMAARDIPADHPAVRRPCR